MLVVALLALIAIVRVILTYHDTAQAFDEPCHVAAALEFLDHGTYSLDPIHPPLARIAIGLPLYLAGERYPYFANGDPLGHDYNVVGNRILYHGGRYLRNITLARLGVLPFLILSVACVFGWTRREFGDFAAVIAVLLFTTQPIALAFSSIAYTDIAAASTQLAALFAFSSWLDRPSRKSSFWLGVALGLAVLSKLTTLIFIPSAAGAIVLCRWMLTRDSPSTASQNRFKAAKQLSFALLLALATVWGGYKFSVGRVQSVMQVTPQSMPSFQHFPAPVRGIARELVIANPLLPIPEFFHALAGGWVLNQTTPQAYLLGKTKAGGWWYFFIVGVGIKSTLPLLLLCAAGLVPMVAAARRGRWMPLAPALSILAIVLATMFVKYNAGVRHVLLIFPLLTIVGGSGAAFLWGVQGNSRFWARTALVGMLACQIISTCLAGSDYLAYFNAMAGSDPSKVLVAGCDLDCGQDVFRLAAELQAKKISHASIAIWSSADMTKMRLPDFSIPQPFEPVTGWLAISLRALRFGDLFHSTYPPGAFAWLDKYQPVDTIGKTILLYHIPENAGTVSRLASERTGLVGSRRREQPVAITK